MYISKKIPPNQNKFQILSQSREARWSTEIKKYDIYVQRVKDILTEELRNPFPNEVDKIKPYYIRNLYF